MSDTPQTDAAADWYLAASLSTDPNQKTVPVALSRKLERERDEWRKTAFEITSQANKLKIQLKSECDELQKKYDTLAAENMLEVHKLCKERDEARKKIKRQTDRIRTLEGATNHACGTPLSIAIRERDEARHEIEGWRNKWNCAVEMGARAMVERDEARALAEERKQYWEDSIKEYEELRKLYQAISRKRKKSTNDG